MNGNSNLVSEKQQKPDSLFDLVVSKLQNTMSGEERIVPNVDKQDRPWRKNKTSLDSNGRRPRPTRTPSSQSMDRRGENSRVYSNA